MSRMSVWIWILCVATLIVSTTGCRVYTERDHAKQSNRNIAELQELDELLDSTDIFAEQFPNSAAYILNLEHDVENVMYAFGNSLHAYQQSTMNKLYVVFDPDDEDYSTFSLELQEGEENLNVFKAQVVGPNGEVQTYDKDDLQWTGQNDATAKLAFNNIVEGSIVQIVYDTFEPEPEGFVSGFVPLQFSVPVRRLDVSLFLPDELVVRFKEIETDKRPEYKLGRKKIGLSTLDEYRFVRENVEAVHDEPYSPYLLDMAEYATYKVVGFRSFSYYGNNFFSSDVGSSLRTVSFLEGNRNGKRFIRRFTDDVVEQAGAKTQEEKIDAVIDWVMENTEVDYRVDRPTYQELVEDGQGDKWTITDLLRAMLDHLRVESEYVFIHDGRYGNFDENFLDGSMRTPAIRFMYKGESTICLPYLPSMPLGMLPPHLMHEPAYFIKGYSNDGYYDTISEGTASTSVMEEEFSIRIDEKGIVHVVEVTRYGGTGALFVAESYEEASESDDPADLKEFYESFVTYDEGQIVVENPSFDIEQSKEEYKVIVRVEYSIDNLVTILPDEVVFQTGGLLAPNTDYSTNLNPSERVNAINIRVNESNTKTINITYPKKWELYSTLSGAKIKNELGRAQITFDQSIGSLTIGQEQHLNRGEWSTSYAKELYELIDADAGAKVPTLVFTK